MRALAPRHFPGGTGQALLGWRPVVAPVPPALEATPPPALTSGLGTDVREGSQASARPSKVSWARERHGAGPVPAAPAEALVHHGATRVSWQIGEAPPRGKTLAHDPRGDQLQALLLTGLPTSLLARSTCPAHGPGGHREKRGVERSRAPGLASVLESSHPHSSTPKPRGLGAGKPLETLT